MTLFRIFIGAAVLIATATPAFADPATATALVTIASQLAIASIPGIGPVLASAVVATATMINFASSRERALPETRSLPERLKAFGLGPHLIGTPEIEISGNKYLEQLIRVARRFGEKGAVKFLERQEARDLAHIRKHLSYGPTDFTAVSAIHGICVSGFADDGTILWCDSGPICPGDFAIFVVEGEPWKRGKFYLGRIPRCDLSEQLFGSKSGPFFVFWQWDPTCMVIVPMFDVTTILRGSHIYRDGVLTRLNAMETRDRWLADAAPVAELISGAPAPSLPFPDGVLEAHRELLGLEAPRAARVLETAVGEALGEAPGQGARIDPTRG